MPIVSRAGIDIAYETAGEGGPVLLIHGFASTGRVNWWDTGWVQTLTEVGRTVVTFDQRGHGASSKFYDPADYGLPALARDAAGLLSHLGIARADVIGYSMGARVAALLSCRHGGLVRRAVLGGLAANIVNDVAHAEAIARGLEALSLSAVSEPAARAFRQFAERTGGDLKALAACLRSGPQGLAPAELAAIRALVLVVAGELDDIAGPVEPLLGLMPKAEGLTLPRRDHMTAVGDQRFKEAVLRFLGAGPAF